MPAGFDTLPPGGAFGASPSRGLRTAAPSLPAQAWTVLRVSDSDADAACKAHWRPGKAGSAVSLA